MTASSALWSSRAESDGRVMPSILSRSVPEHASQDQGMPAAHQKAECGTFSLCVAANSRWQSMARAKEADKLEAALNAMPRRWMLRSVVRHCRCMVEQGGIPTSLPNRDQQSPLAGEASRSRPKPSRACGGRAGTLAPRSSTISICTVWSPIWRPPYRALATALSTSSTLCHPLPSLSRRVVRPRDVHRGLLLCRRSARRLQSSRRTEFQRRRGR
jgi:hypothetical protein